MYILISSQWYVTIMINEYIYENNYIGSTG